MTPEELGADWAYPSPLGHPYYHDGLTKREAFAMAAMQGMCADPNCMDSEKVAIAAVKFADSLLAELAKEKQ